MHWRRFGIMAAMDVLLLAELTFGIWLAHDDPSTIAWTFSRAFVPMALATVIGARVALKRLCPPELAEHYRPVGIFGPRG